MRHHGTRFRRRAAVAALLLATAAVGCRRELPTTYGFQRPAGSVNGTEVLADLFRAGGHEVSGWPWLSPRLADKADCIVWFSQSFDPPTKDVRRWFDDWLRAKRGRTLIYVARDYDAAVAYWRKIREGTSGEQYKELSRELADALNEFQHGQIVLDPSVDGGWYKLDRTPPRRRAKNLEGAARWLEGIDRGQTEIELGARMTAPGRADVLLSDADAAIVSRTPVRSSQRIVVANGSFLVNLALVNREHRKLAAALVNEIGPPSQKVVFLESRWPSPPILDKEPNTGLSLFRFFGLEPINLILLQVVLLGTVFLFRRAPIFGLPRSLPDPALSDFGQHVEALGQLLERQGDLAHARARVEHYESLAHRDSVTHGRRHIHLVRSSAGEAKPGT
jgi:hypothetical protein